MKQDIIDQIAWINEHGHAFNANGNRISDPDTLMYVVVPKKEFSKFTMKKAIFTSSISGTLKPGDLIVIADSSYLTLGFYLGIGKTGCLHYYSFYNLINWLETKDQRKRLIPYKSYVVNPYHVRIAKFHEDNIADPGRLEEYYKCREALEMLKLI